MNSHTIYTYIESFSQLLTCTNLFYLYIVHLILFVLLLWLAYRSSASTEFTLSTVNIFTAVANSLSQHSKLETWPFFLTREQLIDM